MKILPKNKKALVEAALGKRLCHLVIENAQIVNLFTGEIYKGDIGIYDGFIAHIQCNSDETCGSKIKMSAENYYDAKGKYLIPGLIDAHMHIESTMMTPRNLAQALIPCGTTTIITDPHEIANVCGIEGVKYMHECSEDLPMRQYILVPSCVPSVPGLENSGAEFADKEVNELLKLDRVIGLAEVMDFLGVINNNKRMTDIIKCVEDKNLFIQGHAPFLTGRELSAYLCAGPVSDHESRTAQEAKDKMRNGMYVDGRESSISQDLSEVIKGIKNFRYLDHLTLCTDDREPEDIIKRGHMNYVVRKAISYGINPIDAVRSATLNTAREIGIKNLGAVAPGYVADLLLVNTLDDMIPSAVFFEGTLVAENGDLKVEIENKNFSLENKNTVQVKSLSLEDFKVPVPGNKNKIRAKVINYEDLSSSTTNMTSEELPVKDGFVDLSQNSDLKFVIVINRYNGDFKGHGIVRNFGTRMGAVGSTVSHDSHNITIVYDNPENAYEVAKDLIQMGGGISCALDGNILEHLALPVAGLISKKPCKLLAEESTEMKSALRKLGLTEIKNPLLRIATLALIVIPNVKISDLGIVDVLTQKIIDLF